MAYKSAAQRGWAHTPAGTAALGGSAKVAEWDSASKGKKLPYHVKKRSMKNGQVSERARGRMEAKTSNGAKDSSGGKDPDNIPAVSS